MSMAIKIAAFMFALNLATVWVNTMGIFQSENYAGWTAAGYENWQNELPSSEGTESVNQIADYFKTTFQLLVGGIIGLITMIGGFVFGIGGFAVKIGLGRSKADFIPLMLQLVAWWSYRLALIEMKSGRNVKEIY